MNHVQCLLHHMSKTNPTVLNGNEITGGDVLLNDNDEIVIGERSFRFKAG